MRIIRNLLVTCICLFAAYHAAQLWANVVSQKGAPCTSSTYIPPLGPGVYADIWDGAHCTAVALCDYPEDPETIIYISMFADLGCPNDQVYNTVSVNSNTYGFSGSASATDMSNLLLRGVGAAWTYCSGGSGTSSTSYPDVCGKPASCGVN
jgi:hypothetical protein